MDVVLLGILAILIHMKLKRKFFNKPTLAVARGLLGKYLVRRIGSRLVRARITETEAYCGFKDKASHASRGLTERTKLMFGPPGFFYVYMIYGMYHCLNVVTGKEGYPAAVLIRGVDRANCDGPGKICRELKIIKKLNGIDLCNSDQLWIEDSGVELKKGDIKKGKRVGVDYAGKWKDKLWRLYLD